MQNSGPSTGESEERIVPITDGNVINRFFHEERPAPQSPKSPLDSSDALPAFNLINVDPLLKETIEQEITRIAQETGNRIAIILLGDTGTKDAEGEIEYQYKLKLEALKCEDLDDLVMHSKEEFPHGARLMPIKKKFGVSLGDYFLEYHVEVISALRLDPNPEVIRIVFRYACALLFENVTPPRFYNRKKLSKAKIDQILRNINSPENNILNPLLKRLNLLYINSALIVEHRSNGGEGKFIPCIRDSAKKEPQVAERWLEYNIKNMLEKSLNRSPDTSDEKDKNSLYRYLMQADPVVTLLSISGNEKTTIPLFTFIARFMDCSQLMHLVKDRTMQPSIFLQVIDNVLDILTKELDPKTVSLEAIVRHIEGVIRDSINPAIMAARNYAIYKDQYSDSMASSA